MRRATMCGVPSTLGFRNFQDGFRPLHYVPIRNNWANSVRKKQSAKARID